MRGISFLLLFSLLFFSGCSTFKGAMDPYSLAPESSSELSEVTITHKNYDLDWMDFSYLSEDVEYTLGELIDIALKNNPDTKISWEDARESSAMYGESLQNYFPQLQGELSYVKKQTPNYNRQVFHHSTLDSIYNGNLSLSYLILDFGQTRASSQSALFALKNTDLTHNRQIQTTIQTVMNDYYGLLYEKELYQAKEQDVQNAQVSFDAANERLRTGVGDLGDLMQAKTMLLQNKLSQTSQKQQLHNAYTKLSKDLGVPPEINLQTQNFPTTIQFIEPKPIQNLVEEAKMFRPDYSAAIANVISKQEAVNAAFRQHYPKVNGLLSIGKTKSNHGLEDNYDFKGQITLTVPLFTGFYIQNNVNRQESSLQIAEFKLDRLQLAIQQELSNYREEVVLAKEEVEFSKAFLESAETDFAINLEKYKVGTNTIVQLINAQTSVADARAKYIRSKKNWYSSLANLAYATGCLYAKKPKEEI